MGLTSSTNLSCEAFIRRLGADSRKLSFQYRVEVLIGLLFSAALATVFEYAYLGFKGILNGIKSEFLRHAREQGATDENILQLDSLFMDRMCQYSTLLSNDPRDEERVLQDLSKQLYWNIVGCEEDNANAIVHAQQYLFAASTGTQAVLKEFCLDADESRLP